MTALVCAGLSRRYASAVETIVALDDVSLTIEKASFVALRGRSGSGKSTLLNVIAGLDRPDSGSVQIDGEPVSDFSEATRTAFRLRKIGVVFQDNNLIPEFTMRENVELPLRVMGWSAGRARAAALDAMAALEIAELAHRYPREASAGQRQRCGFARAVVGDRTVILADEPTGALDTATAHRLFGVIGDLCIHRGVLALVATHDPAVDDFAHRSVTIVDGRLNERAHD